MRRDAWLWGGLALAALMYWKKDTIMSYTYSDDEAMANTNVIKLLMFVGKKESNWSYTILYRPSHTDPLYDPTKPRDFSDFSTHPNIRIPFTLPDGTSSFSTAAGFFQINHPTWVGIQASRIATGRGALPDFSPTSQWLGAIEILRMDGDLPAIYAGDWPTVLHKINKRWASMPGDPTGQSHLAYADVLAQLQA